MWSIARAVATGQPRTAANRSLGQFRTAHPSLRRKIRKNREKKLERRLETLMSMEETRSVLLKHCSNRGISLNKRQRNKPWIMALLTHRYDKGVRDLDELNAGGLRHVLTPKQDVVHDHIHATVPSDVPHRFSNRNYKKAVEEVRMRTMETFAREALRIMRERRIPRPMLAMNSKIEENPAVFLSLFSRAMAEAEPDGSARDFSSSSSSSRKKKKTNGRRKEERRDGRRKEEARTEP